MTGEDSARMANGTSTSLKYACIERERRFLIRNPILRSANARCLAIRDRYLIGTRLRLRSVEEAGVPTVFKLGQKIRIDKDLPCANAHTTIYVSSEEYDLFTQLPANELEKVRWLDSIGGFTLAIDEFGGPLTGLVLAEVDLGAAGTLPDDFLVDLSDEVTVDERFSGGALAVTTSEELSRILRSY